MLNIRIKELRILKNLSQVELGKALGVSKQSVSNWENNNIQPSIDILIHLAKFFSVSADYLLGLENERYLQITDLTETELQHIQFILNDLRQKKE